MQTQRTLQDEKERAAAMRAESKRCESLDMALVEKSERQQPRLDHELIQRSLENECVVVFELPDGSEGENRFKLGQTVQVLKNFVQDEYDIPMSHQRLYLDDKLMLDPLTLADYPAAAGTYYVRVDGELPPSSRR